MTPSSQTCSTCDIWNVFTDSSTDSIQRVNGIDTVGGTDYEIKKIAYKQVGSQLLIVVESNLEQDEKVTSLAAADDLIGWGDFFLNFTGQTIQGANGSLYAVRITQNDDPSITKQAPNLGLFKNVTAKSVASENGLLLTSLNDYINYVNNNGGTHGFGDPDIDANHGQHFDGNQHVFNVIETGEYVSEVEFVEVNDARLADLGFTPTFAFAIDASALPEGDFVASFSPECNNDLVAFEGSLTFDDPEPAIAIIKETNGEDAATIDDAVGVAPDAPLVWDYIVTNPGNVDIPIDQITVTDNLEGEAEFDPSSDLDGDGILSPEESITFTITAPNGADDLYTVIDFETDGLSNPLTPGTFIDDQYASQGVFFSSPDAVCLTPDGSCSLMIFDSSDPTGDDEDLGSPNQAFGGPGEGPGGANGKYRNDQDLENILIISEDNNIKEPDDNAKGGTIQMTFPDPVVPTFINILDASQAGDIVLYDQNGALVDETLFPDYNIAIEAAGVNSLQTVVLPPVPVSRIDIKPEDSIGIESAGYTRFYQNEATVTVVDYPELTDSDTSTYITEKPSIQLEKSTFGIDADTPEEAAIAKPGEDVEFRYSVLNDGNMAFAEVDISVTDDQGVIPVLDATTDIGGDRILSPGERWDYIGVAPAEDLSWEIDWETDADGSPLDFGTLIDDEYQDLGVTVSTPGYDDRAMLFDTANPTGGDTDLHDPNLKKGGDDLLGNVLIFSEDGNSANPDDNAKGGTFLLEFDELVGVCSVGLLDIDTGETVTFRTLDRAGDLLNTYVFDGTGDNTIQTADINAGLVAAMEVELSGSGAITGLEGYRVYSNIGEASAMARLSEVIASDISHYVNSEMGCA